MIYEVIMDSLNELMLNRMIILTILLSMIIFLLIY